MVGRRLEGCEARVRGGMCLTWPDARFVYVQYSRVRKQARGDNARDWSEISPFLHKFLHHLGTSPAYIPGRRWDLLAWNRAACSIFGDFAALPAQERNIVRFIFTNGELRRRLVDWEGVAQRALAQFRASSGQYTDDTQFAALIADLQHSSLEFARWWPRHEVQGRRDGRKEFIHPQVGYMALEYNTFQVNELPDLKVVVYLPASEETASKLKQLLGHEAVQV